MAVPENAGCAKTPDGASLEAGGRPAEAVLFRNMSPPPGYSSVLQTKYTSGTREQNSKPGKSAPSFAGTKCF